MTHSPDNPSKALDALVHALLNRDSIQVSELVQGIFRKKWKLSEFPDPAYSDDLHQALAASALEGMAEVWAGPLHERADTAPAWCQSTPASKAFFCVIPPEVRFAFEGEPRQADFARRNIDMPKHYLYFA